MQEITFSDSVESVIDIILPNDDPLNSPEFDPIAYLNERFQAEASLNDMSNYAGKLDREISKIDDNIFSSIKKQSCSDTHPEKVIKETRGAIDDLFKKIIDIKTKARQSEVMVQEICRDIKQLDFAKNHLTVTISALKRLQMLITAIDRLSTMASKRQYKEAAELMGAVNQLIKYFRSYAKVPKVRDLIDRVGRIKEELSHQIFEDFNDMGEIGESSGMYGDTMHSVERLHNACMVVDALEGKTKIRLINAFVRVQLRKYDRIFRKGTEEGSLEAGERRFSWFRRLLKEYDTFFGKVFPVYWGVPLKLTLEFCDKTREHFESLLSEVENPEEVDAAPMLKSLQKSIAFEKEMKSRFEYNTHSDVDGTSTGEVELDDEGNVIDPSSAEGIKRKYAKLVAREEYSKRQDESKKEREDYEKRVQSGSVTNTDAISSEDVSNKITGKISLCFEPYMGGYLRMEREKMQDLIDIAGGKEDKISHSSSQPVLESSIKLFQYIKTSIQRCTALNTGQTFFGLQKEYKTALSSYCEHLQSNIPKSCNISTIGPTCYKVKDDETRDFLCIAINTCEYYADTLPQLETLIQNKIDDAFKKHINFEKRVDKCYEVISLALDVLVSGLDVELDPPLTTMSSMPWRDTKDVGDMSPYVLSINETLLAYTPPVRELLSESYFRNFTDKVVIAFLPRVTVNIYKCKLINEMGAQQLLLDTHAIKTLFLKLPHIGLDDASLAPDIPNSLIKTVNSETHKAEILLKLIGTPEDRLKDSFRIIYGPEGTGDILAKIMTLKGIKSNVINEHVSNLGLERSSGTNGTSTSSRQNTLKDVTRTFEKMFGRGGN